MILSYFGNPKHLSNKEIRELIKNPLLNGVNRSELIAELNTRYIWSNSE